MQSSTSKPSGLISMLPRIDGDPRQFACPILSTSRGRWGISRLVNPPTPLVLPAPQGIWGISRHSYASNPPTTSAPWGGEGRSPGDHPDYDKRSIEHQDVHTAFENRCERALDPPATLGSRELQTDGKRKDPLSTPGSRGSTDSRGRYSASNPQSNPGSRRLGTCHFWEILHIPTDSPALRGRWESHALHHLL